MSVVSLGSGLMRSAVYHWLERVDIEVDESEDGGCFNYSRF